MKDTSPSTKAAITKFIDYHFTVGGPYSRDANARAKKELTTLISKAVQRARLETLEMIAKEEGWEEKGSLSHYRDRLKRLRDESTS